MPSEDEDFTHIARAIESRESLLRAVAQLGEALPQAVTNRTLVVSPSVARVLSGHMQLASKKWTLKGSTVAKSKRKRGHAN